MPTRERYRQVPNFFASFRYLLELDVALAALCFGCQYTALYCLLTTFPSLLETYYNLNQLEIGLCFLAQGLGGIMGSVLEGHLLNRDFRIAARKHGLSETAMPDPDFPIFHARLRSAWIKVGLIQVSIFSYGWCFEYHTHLSVILVLHTIGKFFLFMSSDQVYRNHDDDERTQWGTATVLYPTTFRLYWSTFTLARALPSPQRITLYGVVWGKSALAGNLIRHLIIIFFFPQVRLLLS